MDGHRTRLLKRAILRRLCEKQKTILALLVLFFLPFGQVFSFIYVGVSNNQTGCIKSGVLLPIFTENPKCYFRFSSFFLHGKHIIIDDVYHKKVKWNATKR